MIYKGFPVSPHKFVLQARAAKSVKYDKKKAVIEPVNDTITPTPKADGTIETNYLKQYEDLLSRIMKPVFEGYQEENSGATLSFELDSFYKSFDFAIEDHLLVEVFDYEYYMKSKDAIIMTDGMYRDKDRNIRLFYVHPCDRNCFQELTIAAYCCNLSERTIK